MSKRKVLIWGAAARGEKAYQQLKEYSNYEVIAFGDNDKNLCGKEKHHIPIIGPRNLTSIQNIDCILIASIAAAEIEKQLMQIVNTPIYSSIEKLMFQRISIDISGYCNAKCKWCVTGRSNRQSESGQRHYMSYSKFVELYEHLYQNGIIAKYTEIMLYSWGEPFLNKDYIQIIEYLAEQGQKFSVSTNASTLQLASRENTYKSCSLFIFSMSGFSQESYDHIHGFSFEKIVDNIRKLNKNIREKGFEGEASISYHVYKFNKHEIEQAEKFSRLLNLKFHPYYPYFNGNSMMAEWLEDRMQQDIKKDAEQELYLSHVKELLYRRPKDYHCFLENIISIDCDGNLVLCCASDVKCINYLWGSVFEIDSYEEMLKKRQEMLASNSCKKCRELGMDYWIENNPRYIKEDF